MISLQVQQSQIVKILQKHFIYYKTVLAQHSAHDSWALAKHLKTLPVRFKQSVSNAERLVEFLSQREEIAEVYYPGNNPIHLRQASTGGAVIGLD